MIVVASVVVLSSHLSRNHSMATKLVERVLPFLVMAFVHFVPAYGQCEMQISYAVRDLQSPILGTLILTNPDGDSIVIFSETKRKEDIAYRLEQKGDYRLSVSLDDGSLGKESLEQCFSITGEELRIETRIEIQLEPKDLRDWGCRDSISSARFVITKYSKPSPSVKIKYLYTLVGQGYDIHGPIFSIINESQDTIYGEWLPGYFWGTLSIWKDGSYSKSLGETIDLEFVDKPPLSTGSESFASVGSFGRNIPFGKYRYNLLYSTEGSSKNSIPLIRESDSFRWWGKVQNWYLLTCDFVVDSYFSTPSSR